MILQGLKSDIKLFVDGTLLYSVVDCVNTFASALNSDLTVIKDSAYRWKMSFNPDKNKYPKEVLFSRKTKLFTHPPRFFNKSEVKVASDQKHLGLNIDSDLLLNDYIPDKNVGLLR